MKRVKCCLLGGGESNFSVQLRPRLNNFGENFQWQQKGGGINATTRLSSFNVKTNCLLFGRMKHFRSKVLREAIKKTSRAE